MDDDIFLTKILAEEAQQEEQYAKLEARPGRPYHRGWNAWKRKEEPGIRWVETKWEEAVPVDPCQKVHLVKLFKIRGRAK